MQKQLVLLAVLIFSLWGCGNSKMIDIDNDNESGIEDISAVDVSTEESIEEDAILDDEWIIMEGMQYLPVFAEEDNSYCMVLTGREERGKNILSPDIVLGENNELSLVVESVVKDIDKRKMAVQILVDYEQVPLIVDGIRYDTYYIEAEDNISVSKIVKLDVDIDKSVDHKITVLMMNDLQVHASDSDQRIMINTAAVDEFLICDEKKNKLLRQQVEYERPIGEYEEEFSTILLTLDENGNKRIVPQNTVYAKPGETISFYYHLGGFIKSDETVVFVNVGEKQTKINGKDYLLFHADSPTKVLYGKLELTAPMEEGKYEISAWAVNNPYGTIEKGMQDVYGAPRITLRVEN